MGSCCIAEELITLLCDDHRGVGWGEWLGEAPEEVIWVYLQPIHVVVQQKLTKRCKAIIFQKINT